MQELKPWVSENTHVLSFSSDFKEVHHYYRGSGLITYRVIETEKTKDTNSSAEVSDDLVRFYSTLAEDIQKGYKVCILENREEVDKFLLLKKLSR
jgi:hypothetical protein